MNVLNRGTKVVVWWRGVKAVWNVTDLCLVTGLVVGFLLWLGMGFKLMVLALKVVGL